MSRLQVKVVPSSSRDQVVGWLGEALKVKVMAPPEKGRANAAVIDLLASRLSIDKERIEVISGHSSPAKVLEFAGWDDSELAAALSGLLE